MPPQVFQNCRSSDILMSENFRTFAVGIKIKVSKFIGKSLNLQPPPPLIYWCHDASEGTMTSLAFLYADTSHFKHSNFLGFQKSNTELS